MRHPTEGVLRRLLDEPVAVADPDREHVAACPECLGRLAAMRKDAALVGAALAPGADAEVDVAAAWRRLQRAGAVAEPAHAVAPPRPHRWRGVLRRPAVAAFAAAVVLTGAGTAAANGWLPIFQTERIAPLSLSSGDLVAVPDLTAYGDVDVTEEADVTRVRDAAAAEARTGLEVPRVATLPRGVGGEPAYQAGGRMSATFTFSKERAARAAAAAGEPLPPPPSGLDGSRVRLDAGPGLAAVWSQAGGGVPELVVARARAPRAFSSGVPFETVRDYVLSLPGLSDEVAAKLRTFSADGSTLPLPVPADRVTAGEAEIDGKPATVLRTRDRSLTAVVWVADGIVTVVAGPLDPDEVLSVARELR